MRFLRCLVILADLLIPLFLTITLALLFPLTTTLLLKIFPSALVPLILQGDTYITFSLVTGQTTNGFYFRWPTNLKFSENKLKFKWEKNAQNITKNFLTKIKP